MNLKIAKAAYNQAETVVKIEKLKSKPLPLISGNEAIALGAISAGLEAYVGYPMTPSTGVLNYMAQVATENNIRVYQPENEISAINTAIGLAFSGRKTMTGSSGGGFERFIQPLILNPFPERPSFEEDFLSGIEEKKKVNVKNLIKKHV